MPKSFCQTCAGLLALGLLGCGEDFAPPSEIHGLRVLAVRPDPGSGVPGATVRLEMLYADNRPWTESETGELAPPPVSIAWVAGCHNPPSRQYFACGPVLTSLASTGGLTLGDTSVFEFEMPADILSAAPVTAQDSVHFGVSYVFFAACQGHFDLDPAHAEGPWPACLDDATNAVLGTSSRVNGFSTIYSYDGPENQNHNPMLTGIDFGGEPVQAAAVDAFGQDGKLGADVALKRCTTDEECVDARFERPRGCSEHGVCAPVVKACEGDSCRGYRVLPRLDPSSVEPFAGGNEIMWASYYATAGEFASPDRLVVDRGNGLARDISDGWRPPAPSGSGERRSATLWATVNDQRGGASWAYFDVLIED